MSALFWYISIGILGLVFIAFTIIKKKYNKRELATWVFFYLFTTCITWIGEFAALGYFNGYAYKPGVYNDYFAENILGHLILNSTLYPGTAIFVTAFSLSYGWTSLITAGYVLIEVLFLKLGIYEHNWWRYFMSTIIVFLFHLISVKWYKRMMKVRHGMTRLISFYFVAFIIMYFPNPIILLSGLQYYNAGWYENMYKDSSFYCLVYYLLLTLVIVLFVCALDKWYWKITPLIIFLISDITIINANILIFQRWWNLAYLTFTHVICLAALIYLEKHTLKVSIDGALT